ncbi:CvpA family protein [Hujiaoplasma nucleasis]|uniref:CvpA family protein n=1 Tax=Hujiaoplasma nucleasis TaxID=2725268 RepID=A0A7L6N1R8_9MOLU|nr:CvpA family protein [Hujiaoplasma nucleasis]QLY39521.1 CvpA family protein [Hujiaoplasma nucleasis]
MNIFNLFGIFDVLIVIAVIAMIIMGWKKGFLLKIVELASGLFGLIASLLLTRPFSNLLDKWFGSDIETRIRDHLISKNPELSDNLTEPRLKEALEGLSMPDFITKWISDSIDYEEATRSIIEAITPLFKTMILIVIAFLTLFFGSMIIFFFLKLLSKAITRVPIIRQIDKVLGAFFGLFKVSMIIFVLLLLLSFVLAIPAINNAIGDFVYVDMQLSTDSFRLSKWLYNNNIFRFIINIFLSII